MKQRILAVILTLTFLVTLLPITAFAVDNSMSGDCGEGCRWSLDSSGQLNITSNSSTAIMQDYRLYSLPPWYDWRDSITSVNIGEGITQLGNYSFYYCYSITNVNMPNSLTKIGEHAFHGCTSLREIVIPANVSEIGFGALQLCSSLTDVTIPNGITRIDMAVFYSCKGLKSITLPDSIKNIWPLAFDSCTELKDVFYAGSKAEWEQITIDNSNSPLETATIHYAKNSYTLSFDANGGSVNTNSKSVTNGREYGYLPVPSRNGYNFLGWFTSATGGSQVTATDQVNLSADQTLYAHWDEVPKQYTVSFNPNGGIVGTISKTVTYGESYGTLPNPTRSGYTFSGWFTSAIGGSQISASTIVNLSADQTLYAHWSQDSKTPTLSGLTYRFSNSFSGFGYSSNYRIPLSRYQLMYGDNTLAKYYYNMDGQWGGNCFGMSSTSNMFFQEGNGISTTAFKSGSQVPYDLTVNDSNSTWGLSLKEYIEAMQISQYSNYIQSAYQDTRNNLNGLCRAVLNFKQTGQDPVVIAIFTPYAGHAIVGYDIVDVSRTQSRLMVYDCNYPNAERYITLDKNGSNYTNWYYAINDSIPADGMHAGCQISYVPYSSYMQVWNERKGAGNVNLLTINADDALIRDNEGNIAATIRNGEVISNRDDIYPMLYVGTTADGNSSDGKGTSLCIPSNELYTISNTDDSTQTLEATMVNVDQSASVSTTASEVTFGVDDSQKLNYVEIAKEPGNTYDISLNSSLDTGYGNIQFQGTTTTTPVALAQISGKLYADGQDNATIIADGRAVSKNEIVGSAIQTMGGQPTPSLRFNDVDPNAYYAEAVTWAVAQGVTSGTSATTFSPNAACTRGQIVTFLWRAAGKPEPSSNYNPFVDVKSSDYFYKPVLWAVEKNITSGTDSTHFSPSEPCTRDQAVTFLWRSEGQPNGRNSSFTDVPANSYYKSAVDWAVENKITSGTSTTTFSPKATCTRGQIVTFLFRSTQSSKDN